MVTGHYGHQRDVDLLPGLRSRDDHYGTGLCVVTTSEIGNILSGLVWPHAEIQ